MSGYLVPLTSEGLADMRVSRALRRLVEFALDYTNGDQTWAASELGVNPSTLYRWRKRWEREDAKQARRPVRTAVAA